jgi:hypothetical protein
MDLDTVIIAVFCWIDEALPAAGGALHERAGGRALFRCRASEEAFINTLFPLWEPRLKVLAENVRFP